MKRSLTTKIALFLLQNIPLSVRKFLFVNLAVLVYYLVPGRRLIALYNLTRAFPEKSENELTRIAKGVYRNFGILLAEFVDIPHLNAEKINDLTDIKGMEKLLSALLAFKKFKIELVSIYVDILKTDQLVKTELASTIGTLLEESFRDVLSGTGYEIYGLEGEVKSSRQGRDFFVYVSLGFGGRGEITRAVLSILEEVT